MTAEAKTIDARALTERARVLRILREREGELRARGSPGCACSAAGTTVAKMRPRVRQRFDPEAIEVF